MSNFIVSAVTRRDASAIYIYIGSAHYIGIQVRD